MMKDMSTHEMNVIRTLGLTKRFGKETVVDSLELQVPSGVVYGFLGPNGSGKSTTMKMLLGLMDRRRVRCTCSGSV